MLPPALLQEVLSGLAAVGYGVLKTLGIVAAHLELAGDLCRSLSARGTMDCHFRQSIHSDKLLKPT